MAASDLNVRVALDLRELRKSTREMERMFQQTSDNLASIGNKMVLGITAPILGIGAAAIKSAGDMEALRVSLEATMGNAGRSIGEARNELEQLRVVGKDPGIDFEQAVKASLRLQGVGMSAETARSTIQALGKAIATAGGSPESLDRVTVQMAQMIGKGKVLATDLQVMKESLPSLAGLMQKAFGATTAEGIRDMNINAEEFIKGITAEMAVLKKVDGGINNAIVNMMNSIKMAAASVGEDLNKMFDISGAMDSFGNWVEKITAGWRGMSTETKETIIQIVAFAAALGPAFKLVQLGTIAISAYTSVMAALKAAQLSASVAGGGLIATFKALDAATKATVIGAVVAVVLALGAAFLVTAKEATAAQLAQEKVISVQQDAAASAELQARKVNDLTNIIASHKTSLDEKRGALKELQKISPEYYGKFGSNIKDTQAIAAATRSYTQELIRLKTVEGATAEIAKLNTEIAKLGTTTELSFGESASAVTSFVTSLGGLGTMSLDDFYNEQKQGSIAKQTENINAQIKALEGLVEQNFQVKDIVPPANKAITGTGEAAGKAKKAIDEETASMKDLINTLDVLTAQNISDTGASGEVGAAPTIAGPTLPTVVTPEQNDELLRLVEVLSSTVPNAVIPAQTALESLKESFSGLMDDFSKGGEAQTAIFEAVGASIVDMTNSGSVSLKDFAKNAVASSIKIAKAYAVQGIFAAVSKALQNVPFPLNLVAAGAAAGVAGALLNGLANRIAAPKLAKGGLAFGQTTAIVGDNPGASVDPEVIAPLSKLRQYMGDGGTNITGEFRMRGNDMVAVIDKNRKINNRIRGN